MKYDIEYLAGLEIAEKDGNVRLLKVPYMDGLEKYANNVLLALQEQGYEVLNACPVSGIPADVQGLWITYK